MLLILSQTLNQGSPNAPSAAVGLGTSWGISSSEHAWARTRVREHMWMQKARLERIEVLQYDGGPGNIFGQPWAWCGVGVRGTLTMILS